MSKNMTDVVDARELASPVVCNGFSDAKPLFFHQPLKLVKTISQNGKPISPCRVLRGSVESFPSSFHGDLTHRELTRK
jgi:hypothetical protein